MEQDQKDKVREPAEAWGEVEVDGRAEVLRQVQEATVSAPSAGKKRRIKWAHPAMSSDVPNVGLR